MSTEYIYFTAEQKEAARQTDLVAFLQSQGERLKRSGKEYVWRDGSEKVTVRGNLWFHQYERNHRCRSYVCRPWCDNADCSYL